MYSGGTPKTSNKNYYGGNIPFIKSGEINNTTTSQCLTEIGIKESSAKKVNKGDLLFALYGATSGEVAISKIDGAINQAVLKIDNNMNKVFQYNYFIKRKSQIIRKYIQGGQGNLSAKIIKNLEFYYPTLNEQEKIANFLSVLDKKIELMEKKYQFIKKYKMGLMQKIFSQEINFKGEDKELEVKKIGDYLIESKIVGEDKINKRLTVKLNLKGVYPRDTTTVEKIGATKQYIRKAGQFIYGKQNLFKGAFGIVPDYLDGYLSSSDIPSFDFKKNINPIWFYYYFSRESFYTKLEDLSTGTGSKRVSPNDFLKIKISIPSLKEQNEIADFLSKIDNKIDSVEQQLEKMKEFKKYLLQQMFV